MEFQIKGEQTARTDGRSLCRHCKCSHVIEGTRPSEILIRCMTNWNQPLDMTTWIVTKCNEFIDDAQPSIDALEKIAWRVKADPKKQKVGFQTPDEYRREQREQDNDFLE